MKGRISFHEGAERELIDAVSFFQSKRPEIGGAFIHEVERAIHQIVKIPSRQPAREPLCTASSPETVSLQYSVLGEARGDPHTSHSQSEAPAFLLAR
jgi:hypothetical protein